MDSEWINEWKEAGTDGWMDESVGYFQHLCLGFSLGMEFTYEFVLLLRSNTC